MKALLALAAAVTAAPLSASGPSSLPLPGVADEETTISSAVEDFRRGHGDVLFVRDRTQRWYRLQLNDGCLKPPLLTRNIEFQNRGFASRVTRFTSVRLREASGSWSRTCSIESIRRSVAPPQVNSNSPVTLH
jgi:hypothetical protein